VKKRVLPWRVVTICFCTGVASCAVGPDYIKPVNPTIVHLTSVTEGDGHMAAGFDQGAILARWWEQFQDPVLTGLVGRAVSGNIDLQTSQARIDLARAALTEMRADLYPTVTATALYDQTRVSRETADPVPPGRGLDSWNVGFNAIWELDFFGQNRRAVEAALSNVESAQALERAALVRLVAEVVSDYIELRGDQLQLSLAQDNLNIQGRTLELTRHRLSAGAGTPLDVALAEAQVEATRAAIPPLYAAIDTGRYRLAVLSGEPPETAPSYSERAGDLPVEPELVHLGNIPDLLQRRPDIVAAAATVHQETALVGVSKADLFPKVTFLGSIGYAADKLTDVGSAGTDVHTVSPSISWAAFDIPRVLAEVRAARAEQRAVILEYRQTVLSALEELEGTLTRYGRERERRTALERQESASKRAVEIANTQYRYGNIDLLSVLTAERDLILAQESRAQSQAITLNDLIAVYKALDGAEGAER
jgi:multidrug efflux system outer membrane protein